MSLSMCTRKKTIHWVLGVWLGGLPSRRFADRLGAGFRALRDCPGGRGKIREGQSACERIGAAKSARWLRQTSRAQAARNRESEQNERGEKERGRRARWWGWRLVPWTVGGSDDRGVKRKNKFARASETWFGFVCSLASKKKRALSRKIKKPTVKKGNKIRGSSQVCQKERAWLYTTKRQIEGRKRERTGCRGWWARRTSAGSSFGAPLVSWRRQRTRRAKVQHSKTRGNMSDRESLDDQPQSKRDSAIR